MIRDTGNKQHRVFSASFLATIIVGVVFAVCYAQRYSPFLPNDFRNVRFGMSKAEVKDAEQSATPKTETNSTMVYDRLIATLFGEPYHVRLNYTFSDRGLISGCYNIGDPLQSGSVEHKWRSLEEKLEEHEAFKSRLNHLYNQPIEELSDDPLNHEKSPGFERIAVKTVWRERMTIITLFFYVTNQREDSLRSSSADIAICYSSVENGPHS